MGFKRITTLRFQKSNLNTLYDYPITEFYKKAFPGAGLQSDSKYIYLLFEIDYRKSSNYQYETYISSSISRITFSDVWNRKIERGIMDKEITYVYAYGNLIKLIYAMRKSPFQWYIDNYPNGIFNQEVKCLFGHNSDKSKDQIINGVYLCYCRNHKTPDKYTLNNLLERYISPEKIKGAKYLYNALSFCKFGLGINC